MNEEKEKEYRASDWDHIDDDFPGKWKIRRLCGRFFNYAEQIEKLQMYREALDLLWLQMPSSEIYWRDTFIAESKRITRFLNEYHKDMRFKESLMIEEVKTEYLTSEN